MVATVVDGMVHDSRHCLLCISQMTYVKWRFNQLSLGTMHQSCKYQSIKLHFLPLGLIRGVNGQ